METITMETIARKYFKRALAVLTIILQTQMAAADRSALLPYGVFVYDTDGNFTTSESWNTANNSKVVGIALITETTKAIIALHNANNGKKVVWGPNGLVNGVTHSQTHSNSSPGAAISDYNGDNNTRLLYHALCPGNETALALARYFVFPNGTNGYLPALGELKDVFDNIDPINELMLKVGGEIIENTWYWSSTLHIQEYRAWAYGGNASGSRCFAQLRNENSQLAKTYGAAFIPVRPFGKIGTIANIESLKGDIAKRKAQAIIGQWDLSESKETTQPNTMFKGTLHTKEDNTFKLTEVTWEFGSVTKHKKITREGRYTVEDNNLILASEPQKTNITSRIFPSTSYSNVKLTEVSQMDEEAKKKAILEQQGARISDKEQSNTYRINDVKTNQIAVSRNGHSYILQRGTRKPVSKNLIGRWYASGETFDFRADGTYTQYRKNVSYQMMWEEAYTITISGIWFYDGIDFCVISHPSKSTVKVQIQNAHPQANRVRLQARQKELSRIALEAQAEHRAKDFPKSSIATISYFDNDSFICQDTNNNEFTFTRVK